MNISFSLLSKLLLTAIIVGALAGNLNIFTPEIYICTISLLWIYLTTQYSLVINLIDFVLGFILTIINALSYFIAKYDYFEQGASAFTQCGDFILAFIIITTLIAIALCLAYPQGCQTDKKEHCNNQMALFPERLADYNRIKQYVDFYNIIGLDAPWGSGKSFVIDKLIEDYKDYNIINLNAASITVDSLTTVLLSELEKSLTRHGIFSHFSLKIKMFFLNSNELLKSIGNILFTNTNTNTEIICGFCKDFNRMPCPTIIIWDDLDRINTPNKLK